jgi:hypothetical protein
LIVVCIIIGFFIYYRKLDYYKVLPRYSISASFFVALWSYISIKQPWFIILGLIILNILDRFDMLEKLNN